jgi:hypothetical protein
MKGTCEPIDPHTGQSTCGMADLFGVKKCPNYIETWWTPNKIGGESQPTLVCDCAPKRTLMMIQDLHNRLVGVEKAQEELRNETVWTEVVAHVIGKNIGIDLQQFVEERQRINKVLQLKEDLDDRQQQINFVEDKS